jgi:malate dehydrogenase
MVETILLNQPRILPIAAYLDGKYGLKDLFIGVPVRLGCGGVEEIVELSLTEAEQAALHESADIVRKSLDQALDLL